MANNMRIRDRSSERNKTISGSRTRSIVQDLIKMYEMNDFEPKCDIRKNSIESRKKGLLKKEYEELVIENYKRKEDESNKSCFEIVKSPTFYETKEFFEKNVRICGITCPMTEKSSLKFDKKALEEVESQILCDGKLTNPTTGKVNKVQTIIQKIDHYESISEKDAIGSRETCKENDNNLSDTSIKKISQSHEFNKEDNKACESMIKKPTYFNSSPVLNSIEKHTFKNRNLGSSYLDRFIAIDKLYSRDFKKESNFFLGQDKTTDTLDVSKKFELNYFLGQKKTADSLDVSKKSELNYFIGQKKTTDTIELAKKSESNDKEKDNSIVMNTISIYEQFYDTCTDKEKSVPQTYKDNFIKSLPDLEERTFNYGEILKNFELKASK